MWLVVGLGNPGKEYAGTRHNVGFEVVEALAQRHGFGAPRESSGARVRKGQMGADEVMLVEPQTYMNLSGDAVGALARFYKLEPSNVVVIHDELDFEPGVVRVKLGGGHGGHKGVRSVVAHLGDAFVRVRVGIGKPPHGGDGADWVLARFDGATRRLMEDAVVDAMTAVELVLELGVERAMNRVNRKSFEVAPDVVKKEV